MALSFCNKEFNSSFFFQLSYDCCYNFCDWFIIVQIKFKKTEEVDSFFQLFFLFDF